MRAKKLTVTVGIITHNNTDTIQTLLRAVAAQRTEHCTLQAITIIDDASTDNTLEKITAFSDSKLLVIKNRHHKGITYCQNVLFRFSASDVVVLLAADTCPQGVDYLENLILPLYHDRTLGLVCGLAKYAESNTTISKMFAVYHSIFARCLTQERKLRAWLYSGRGGRAFTKEVYTKLQWPEGVPEDSYAFLWCRARKIKTKIHTKAVCNSRGYQSISEYIAEQREMLNTKEQMLHLFSQSLVNRLFSVPFQVKLRLLFLFIVTEPVLCFRYLALAIYIKCKLKQENFGISKHLVFPN